MKHLSISLLSLLPMLAVAQSQLVLDTMSTVITGTVASNRDRVLALPREGDVLLWRAQANGAPVWLRRIEGPAAPALVCDPDGGCVCFSDRLLRGLRASVWW